MESMPSLAHEQIIACPVAAAIDATGLRCPLPLLRAKQGLRELASGERLRVTATDSGSVRDFHALARISGHELEGFCENDGAYIYLLKKK